MPEKRRAKESRSDLHRKRGLIQLLTVRAGFCFGSIFGYLKVDRGQVVNLTRTDLFNRFTPQVGSTTLTCLDR
jgi:hypothetical protein